MKANSLAAKKHLSEIFWYKFVTSDIRLLLMLDFSLTETGQVTKYPPTIFLVSGLEKDQDKIL